MVKILFNTLLLLTVFVGSSNSYTTTCNIVNGKAYGDCDDIVGQDGKIKPIIVSSSVDMSEIISEARVLSGGFLFMSGVCNGDIVVDRGGKLFSSGVVKGSIINNGGSVEVYGAVKSVQANSGDTAIGGVVSSVVGNGKVNFKKGAVIGGKPVD